MMKTQKTNLSATKIRGFFAVLFIITFAAFAAAQTSRQPAKAANQASQVTLTFINRSNYSAAIYWVNAGKEKLYKSISPESGYLQSTFANHQWRVRMNGKLIGTYAATAAPEQEVEIIVSKSEAAMRVRNRKDAQQHCIPFTPNTSAVWIGKWGSLGKEQPSYCEFASLRFHDPESVWQQSIAADLAIIYFINKTKYPIEIYQINLGGDEKPLKSLNANESFSLSTSLYAGSRWNVRLIGKLVGTYDATGKKSQKVEIAYYLSEVWQIRNKKEAEQECNKLAASKGGIWTGSLSELGDANAPFCQLIRLRTGTESK